MQQNGQTVNGTDEGRIFDLQAHIQTPVDEQSIDHETVSAHSQLSSVDHNS